MLKELFSFGGDFKISVRGLTVDHVVIAQDLHFLHFGTCFAFGKHNIKVIFLKEGGYFLVEFFGGKVKI